MINSMAHTPAQNLLKSSGWGLRGPKSFAARIHKGSRNIPRYWLLTMCVGTSAAAVLWLLSLLLSFQWGWACGRVSVRAIKESRKFVSFVS